MRRTVLLLPALLFLSACTIPAPRETRTEPLSDSGETVIVPGTTPGINASGSTLAERILPSGMLEVGHAQAPVAFTLFTNHSCDYCITFNRLLTDRILTEFVEPGSVRLSIVPVPLQKNPESAAQALLLSCATRQGKGWPMHRALFEGLPSEEQMIALDIDAVALDACLTESGSGRLLPASNVTLVPSYAINGEMYTGLPEWSELRGQINEALRP